MNQSIWGLIPVLLAAAAIGSCSKPYDGGGDTLSLANPVVIRVGGMKKGKGGKT